MSSPCVNFRVPVEDLERLDALVEATGSRTRSAYLLSLIRTNYDMLHGNPQVMQMVIKARELQQLVAFLAGDVEVGPMPAGMEGASTGPRG